MVQINRQELINILDKVKPGLAKREIIQQSTTFAFIGGKVVTYNDSISVSYPIKELDFIGAIEAKEFYELLNKLSSNEVFLSVQDNNLIVQADKSKAGFILQSDIVLPLDEVERSSADSWIPVPSNLKEALAFSLFSCARDIGIPAFTCVHLNKDGFVEATDNVRITRYKVDSTFPKSVLIRSSSVKALLDYEFTEMSFGNSWIHFRDDSGLVFSCRLFDGRFPNIDETGILNVQGEEVVFPHNLVDMLDRALVFAKNFNSYDLIRTGIPLLDVSFKDKLFKVKIRSDSGWFEEFVELDYAGNPISFSANPLLLRDIVDKTDRCIVGDRCIKFQNDSWEHVIALAIRTE